MEESKNKQIPTDVRKARSKKQKQIPTELKTKNKMQEPIPTERKTKSKIQEDKFNDLLQRVTKLEETQHKNTNGKYRDIECYVHTQFYLALYMCVFILNSFPCGYF